MTEPPKLEPLPVVLCHVYECNTDITSIFNAARSVEYKLRWIKYEEMRASLNRNSPHQTIRAVSNHDKGKTSAPFVARCPECRQELQFSMVTLTGETVRANNEPLKIVPDNLSVATESEEFAPP